MIIYIYADESGVFDHIHNEYYVFGGLIFLNKEDRDIATRKYLHMERTLIEHNDRYKDKELKASILKNTHKNEAFRSLNKEWKFGSVIYQNSVYDNIYSNKKHKQRYLDYALKIAIKRFFEQLISSGDIIPDEVKYINVFFDEHTTATSGLYELREGLLQEFKDGSYNKKWNKFYPPLFDNLAGLNLQYCNSEKHALIRASDIVANKIYYHVRENDLKTIEKKVFITELP